MEGGMGEQWREGAEREEGGNSGGRELPRGLYCKTVEPDVCDDTL